MTEMYTDLDTALAIERELKSARDNHALPRAERKEAARALKALRREIRQALALEGRQKVRRAASSTATAGLFGFAILGVLGALIGKLISWER